MIRKEVASYPVSIFMAGDFHDARIACQMFCNDIGLCVTLTETEYIYTGLRGEEPGFIVGLINYPRFPMDPETILDRAFALAELLRVSLVQESYTVQAPDKTVWISYREEAA